MVAAGLRRLMNRWALPLLVLLVAPLSAADVQFSGTYDTRDDHVPQMHCEFVQTQPHARADPMRCEVAGRLQEAEVMRVRLAGPGRVYAYLYDEVKQAQVAQVECVSGLPATVAHCTRTLGTFGYSGARVTFRAFLEGPGGAAAVVTVERVAYSLP